MEVCKIITVVLCSFLIASESAFVDRLTKCGRNDGVCHRDLVQSILPEISKNGIPELGIPPCDPFQVINATVNVFNMINITMVDGVARGIRNCIVNNFKTNMDDGYATMEITCDILIKGRYIVFSNSPMIKTLLGDGTIHGDGNGKVKIEKLNIKFEYFFDIVERDGDKYIKCKFDKTIYKYDIGGRVIFNADNLYFGKVEQSAMIVNIMNENWKLIMAAVGNNFLDVAMDKYVYIYVHKFFDNTPVDKFINDI